MNIVILLYPKMTALDAIGAYEVFCNAPGVTVTFVAEQAGPVMADSGMLQLVAEKCFADVAEADILLVPGGEGEYLLRNHQPTIDWLRQVDKTTQWTTSVCTGALLLAAAGILEGRAASTHWAFRDELAGLGVVPSAKRVTEFAREGGGVMTAAGVSAGIDMALILVGRLFGKDVGEALELGIEYDPEPPYETGSPNKAHSKLVAALKAQMTAGRG